MCNDEAQALDYEFDWYADVFEIGHVIQPETDLCYICRLAHCPTINNEVLQFHLI